jgi:hypothetical protein
VKLTSSAALSRTYWLIASSASIASITIRRDSTS